MSGCFCPDRRLILGQGLRLPFAIPAHTAGLWSVLVVVVLIVVVAGFVVVSFIFISRCDDVCDAVQLTLQFLIFIP